MMGPARKPKVEIGIYQEYQEAFSAELEKCVTEIFHPEVPFDQTKEEDKCLLCPFKEICAIH